MKLTQLRNYFEKSQIPFSKDSLQVILDEFYQQMSRDVMIGYFFQNKDLKKIVESQIQLLMMVMGFEKKYLGPPVGQAHLSLPQIRRGHFNRRLVILEKVLNQFGLPAEAISDWLSFERQFEEMVVSQ